MMYELAYGGYELASNRAMTERRVPYLATRRFWPNRCYEVRYRVEIDRRVYILQSTKTVIAHPDVCEEIKKALEDWRVNEVRRVAQDVGQSFLDANARAVAGAGDWAGHFIPSGRWASWHVQSVLADAQHKDAATTANVPASPHSVGDAERALDVLGWTFIGRARGIFDLARFLSEPRLYGDTGHAPRPSKR